MMNSDQHQAEHHRLQARAGDVGGQVVLGDRDQLRQHDDEGRAQHRAVQEADAAEDHDGDQLDRLRAA